MTKIIHGNTKVKTLRKIGIPVKGKHGQTTVAKIKKANAKKQK
jgi:hypothetical protein